jgi:hypothetical protein
MRLCEDRFSTIRRPIVVLWGKKWRKYGPHSRIRRPANQSPTGCQLHTTLLFLIVSPFAGFLLLHGLGALATGTLEPLNGPDAGQFLQRALRHARDGVGFSLPWKPMIEQRLGQQLAATLRGGGVSWEIGRQRGPAVGRPAAAVLTPTLQCARATICALDRDEPARARA